MRTSVLPSAEQILGRLYCSPQVLVDVLEACLDGGEPQQLAELLLQDAVLSARVLLAASRTAGQPLDPAEPLSSAVQHLGLPVLTGIALQAARQVVAKSFSEAELATQQGFWFSARVAAQTARCLAPSVNYAQIEEAQLCGLLLNLGMQMLYGQLGDEYAELIGENLGTAEMAQREEESYGVSHLQLVSQLADLWQLDSFLSDAIGFLHVDLEQIEKNSPLLKIARLTQQISRDPSQLSQESLELATRLFSFRTSEIEYLFDWAHSLYRPAAAEADQENSPLVACQQLQGELAELTIELADLEAVRTRLRLCQRPEDLVNEGRRLYLESGLASEAIFLLVDQGNRQLSGIAAAHQPALINQLKIPLDPSGSLACKVLLDGQGLCLLATDRPPALADQQLRRLTRSQGLCYLPYTVSGRPLGVVVLGQSDDNSDLVLVNKRLRLFGRLIGQALLQQNEEIRERLGDNNGLLRRVSHELANPLTVISNYAEVLQHGVAEGERQDLTETIKKEVRRIDEVLNYYLSQQEMPFFPEENVSLNLLLMEAVEALQQNELEPRNIELCYQLQDDLPKLPANGLLIKQVLVNLIKNAAEAVSANGVITLTTRDSYAASLGRMAEIIVHDNGPGISPQVQEKLFRPVVSTKGVSHAGVGLSVVKNMVDDLHGQISCHSSPSSGTSFHLQLPFAGKGPGKGRP